VAPYLINSLLTTEDGGFFRHHGYLPSVFRTVLKENLERGYFRLGGSSITMQMVKNVLLSRDKTLSRKLQELFLSWYVETVLDKRRILEIYVNAIEFGPGIYGIGRASRHYFGKRPIELTPLEAAFFSSILPSPKRRYVYYCRGALTPQWDRYVRRIMSKSEERGLLAPDEAQGASLSSLVFDRREALSERECLASLKRLVEATSSEDASEHPTP
jgi:membrane peptidoglycan carboxypeptidase